MVDQEHWPLRSRVQVDQEDCPLRALQSSSSLEICQCEGLPKKSGLSYRNPPIGNAFFLSHFLGGCIAGAAFALGMAARYRLARVYHAETNTVGLNAFN